MGISWPPSMMILSCRLWSDGRPMLPFLLANSLGLEKVAISQDLVVETYMNCAFRKIPNMIMPITEAA